MTRVLIFPILNKGKLYVKDKSPDYLPVLPSDLIQQVSDRYKVAYQRTSGNSI